MSLTWPCEQTNGCTSQMLPDMFCLLLLLDTYSFLFDVQLVNPECHLPGRLSKPMAVHHSIKSAVKSHSNT